MRVRALGQEDPLEQEMASSSSVFAWKILGQRILAGYSSWGHRESDMTDICVCIHAHSQGSILLLFKQKELLSCIKSPST